MFSSAGTLKQYCTQTKISNLNDLQTAVTANENLENIYFNENGDWLFHEHTDFPIVKTRAEVLGTPLATVTSAKK